MSYRQAIVIPVDGFAVCKFQTCKLSEFQFHFHTCMILMIETHFHAAESQAQHHAHAVQVHITALKSLKQPDREFHHVAQHSTFPSPSARFIFESILS
jgi:hypothetical protein